jgi:hypothetical protein
LRGRQVRDTIQDESSNTKNQMDNQNTDPKQALVEKLKSSTNILVTVSSNPTVDQLASCLGLTLWLNKIGKHATAVFSGDVPSTLEFLQPEATLEKNTDSLRDFIISLDKSKADKLRYKVEDTVVKIFITPYRTSLSADDLEFSQGDFNVDMVVALGVSAQQDLDTAITAHGRILHDATVATITTGATSELGSIAWHDDQTSSLSELVVDLGNTLDAKQLDSQIATALLTGIVAETERFSNDKTTPQTMSVSAQLMSAGANQQLVASKLEEPVVERQPEPASEGDDSSTEPPKNDDGTIEIAHEQSEEAAEAPQFELPSVDPEPEIPATDSQIDEVKETAPDDQPAAEAPAEVAENSEGSRLMTEPPTLGGTLTANSRPDDIMLEPTSDPLTQNASMPNQPLLDHDIVPENNPQPAPPDWMPPQPWMDQPPQAPEPATQPFVPAPDETLAQIEHDVDSPHLDGLSDVDSARDEVMKAMAAVPDTNPDPIQALNAQPIDLNETQQLPVPPASTAFDPGAFAITNDPETTGPPAAPDPELTGPVAQPFTMPLPDALTPPPANPVPPTSAANDPTAPPPVPPPLMPPGFPPAQ